MLSNRYINTNLLNLANRIVQSNKLNENLVEFYYNELRIIKNALLRGKYYSRSEEVEGKQNIIKKKVTLAIVYKSHIKEIDDKYILDIFNIDKNNKVWADVINTDKSVQEFIFKALCPRHVLRKTLKPFNKLP